MAATVFVPLHNHVRYIGELLNSLFEQWRPEFELLLIDDASTDDGLEVVEAILAHRPDIRATVLRTEASEGVGLIHRVLRLARGRVIIRADSDDVALPGRLDSVMARFSTDPECRLVTSNALLISHKSRVLGVHETRYGDGNTRDVSGAADLLYDKRWLGATIAYHRDVYDRFPPLDAELCPYGLDMLLPFRAMLLGSLHYIAEPLVGWRQHATNTHRVSGFTDASDAAQENVRALNLAILAQRIKDVAFLAGQTPSRHLDDVAGRCRARFDAEFDVWCRTRTRARLLKRQGPQPTQAEFRSIMPPLPTLALGETLRFEEGEFGAEFLPNYSGFNRSEKWGTWTERLAHLSLRIVAVPTCSVRLSLRLVAPAPISHQRARIRVDAGDWATVEIGSRQPSDVELRCEGVFGSRIVDILILMPDTVVLTKSDPKQANPHVIGLGLIAISAFRDGPLTADEPLNAAGMSGSSSDTVGKAGA